MQIKKPTQLSLDVRLDFVEMRISILVFRGASMIERFSIACFWIRETDSNTSITIFHIDNIIDLLYIRYKVIFNHANICVYDITCYRITTTHMNAYHHFNGLKTVKLPKI